VRYIFEGIPVGEPYALITSCSDVIDFLKSSETDPRLNSSLIAIAIEVEYRFVARSLSGRGSKGEPDAPITAESEIMDLLRRLKQIRRLDSLLIAIEIELEYRCVTRSLFGWGSKGEPNVRSPLGARTRIY
jgi:hypothetical protein